MEIVCRFNHRISGKITLTVDVSLTESLFRQYRTRCGISVTDYMAPVVATTVYRTAVVEYYATDPGKYAV